MENRFLRAFVLSFLGCKIRSFLSQQVDDNMVLTGYWKVLVMNFSGMGNTVFFETKSWWKDDLYWLLKSSRFGLPKSSGFELFSDGKSWCKDNIYLVYFSFPWYSRTWEIRFLVQCSYLRSIDKKRVHADKTFDQRH